MLNTPKMRFPEFDGKLQSSLLGEIASFSKGKGISKADIEYDGQTECIRYGELYTEYAETISEIVSKTNISTNELVLSEFNDVIIPASGETSIDIATASCVLKDGVALGGDLNIIKSELNGVYLSYYLNTAKKLDIANLAQGNSVVHLYPSQLRTLKINFPEKTEQQKIASFLTSVDVKIQHFTKKKTLLEQYKKGVMHKIFKQEIRFKDENGNEFPEWKEKRLGDIGESFIGLTYSPDDVVEVGGVLILRSSNIQNSILTFDNNVYVDAKISDKNFVKENDILICARNGSKNLIGKSALIKKADEGYAFGAFMTIYRSEFNKYLFHLLQTNLFYEQVNQHLGATINQITTKSLNSFKFQIPAKPEQTKIENFLSALDTKINHTNSLLEKTKLWKKGLLQQLFV